MKQQFTISIYTENHIGMLSRVTLIFTRRHVNIESITASESEIPGVHRLTIVVHETREQVRKIVAQIARQVEVVQAFFHPTNEVVYQEIALYKLPTSAISAGLGLETLIRDNHARILSMEAEFIIIEKTGHKKETQKLFELLEPFGILEFVRSGRVAIMKQMKELPEAIHKSAVPAG